MSFVPTLSILAALKAALLDIQHPSLAGETLFQVVDFHENKKLAEALKDLVTVKQRVAIIVPAGDLYENFKEGRTTRSVRTSSFDLLIADRSWTKGGYEAVVGGANNVGVWRMKDLVTAHLVTRCQLGLPEVVLMPTEGAHITLADADVKDSAGRECFVINYETPAGWETLAPLGSDGFAGSPGTAAFLAGLAPDVVMICALDGVVADPGGAGGILPALQTINTRLAALTVVPDQIIVGLPNTQGDTATATRTYNAAMRDHAKSISAAFVDSFRVLGMWTRANALGFYDDATHPNAAGWALVAQHAVRQLGLDEDVYGGTWTARQDNPRNLWVGDLGVWTATSQTFSTAGTVNNSILPGLTHTLGGGFTGSLTLSRVVIDQNELQTPNRYGLRIEQVTPNQGTSMVFHLGPARLVAGRQATFTFRAKASTAFNAQVFAGRFAGQGNNRFWQLTPPAFGTAWRRYVYTTEFPQLIDAEVANTSASFSINLPASAVELTLTDIEVVLGAAPSGVIASAPADTFVIDLPSIAAGSSTTSNQTFLGLRPGQRVEIQRPSGLPAGLILDVVVTTYDTVQIQAINPTGSAIDPPSLPFAVTAR